MKKKIVSPCTIIAFDIGRTNLSYCILNYNQECIDKRYVGNIINWDCVNIKAEEKKSVRDKINIRYVCPVLVTFLNKDVMPNIQEASSNSKLKYVLIENQPAIKNPMIKSIQTIIHAWFVIKVADNILPSDLEIELPAPASKFKVLSLYASKYLALPNPNELLEQVLPTSTTNKKIKITSPLPTSLIINRTAEGYDRGKSFCVKSALIILNNERSEYWYNYILHHKKRDDLADAYLFALLKIIKL